MIHHIASLIPSAIGEWRVLFPDVPGCEARGSTFDDAKVAAEMTLPHCLKSGLPISGPRDLSEIKRDTQWLESNGVDLSMAVITMIPIAA